jgi:hypothetical protein
MSSKRIARHAVTTHFSDEQFKKVVEAATRLGMSLYSYLQFAALKATEEKQDESTRKSEPELAESPRSSGKDEKGVTDLF